jgi:steroid 5-alpha reductase family enzyme
MTRAPGSQILAGLLMASALMTGLWLLQRRTRNAGVVDAGWAGAIGLLGAIYAVTSAGFLPRRVQVAELIGAWSLRLAAYLVTDRVVGRSEDGRYASMRREWGATADRRFFLEMS